MVQIRFIMLVIPIEIIEKYYPGGFKKYKKENRILFKKKCFNVYYDNDIVATEGAMDPNGMAYLLNKWEKLGVKLFTGEGKNKKWNEICVVEDLFGPTLPCDWINFEFGQASFNKEKANFNVIGDNTSHILEFYKGKKPDTAGRYLFVILNFNYVQLDKLHDYIQWIFPLNKPSYFNKTAPVLTKEEISEFKNNTLIKENILKSLKLILDFYGFHLDEKTSQITKGANFNERIKCWLTPSNCNFQRMTRILKFLRLIGMDNYAISFFEELKYLYKKGYKKMIGKYTYDYWNNAVTGDIELFKSYEEELMEGNKVTIIGWIILGIIFVIIILLRLFL